MLLHVVTEKGHGHPFNSPSAENTMRCPNLMLSLAPIKNLAVMYQLAIDICRSLIAAAEQDPKIVAITAAMPSGMALIR